jgi:adenine-specific DNA methylase
LAHGQKGCPPNPDLDFAELMTALSEVVALKGARSGALPDAAKLRGGYYTPAGLASFLARWAVRDREARVLEPSCGDGEIVAAVAGQLGGAGKLVAVELFEEEARKAAVRGDGRCTAVVGDVFAWFDRRQEGAYDACVGNPPFIRYQSFSEEHRKPAFALMATEGLQPTRLTNGWVPFVVLATKALRPGGRLALVLPAELLQVGYAAEVREYLVRKYTHLSVITFRELVFPAIQQETVLLLGTRRDGDDGRASISFSEVDAPADLSLERIIRAEHVEADLDHAREKWTQYFLSPRELELVRALESASEFTTLGQLAEIDVGVVTGRNEFFVLRPTQAEALGISRCCVPLVGRSAQIPGLVLRKRDWNGLRRSDARCLLLHLGDSPFDDLTPESRAYVEWGEKQGVHEGYKCRIRLPHWWKVPSAWTPDAFLLRQIHDGPRIVENRTRATSTDTIHRVRVKPGVDPRLLAAASINSLTFAFSEIRGRSYGGGVLELEPTEAEGLPYPFLDAKLPVDELDDLARRRGVEAVLREVDRMLLSAAGVDKTEIAILRGVWRKLRERRARRKLRYKPASSASCSARSASSPISA